jgi:hypothetical protein
MSNTTTTPDVMTEERAKDILRTVRAKLGRDYKRAIRDAWMTGNYDRECLSEWAGSLQRIRNVLGPSWFHHVRL